MSREQPVRTHGAARAIKKFFVSGFVVFTFVAYAVHQRLSTQQPVAGAPAPGLSTPLPPAATQPLPASPFPQPASPFPQPTLPPTAVQPALPPPTAVPPAPSPEPPALASGQYKDGQYTGATVDAFYGLVQVQAVIQSGKIASVDFIEYPNDRRTSVRINSVAMPRLKTEAIQTQSADVDIISGATLTSEAFIMSLQSALQSARA